MIALKYIYHLEKYYSEEWSPSREGMSYLVNTMA